MSQCLPVALPAANQPPVMWLTSICTTHNFIRCHKCSWAPLWHICGRQAFTFSFPFYTLVCLLSLDILHTGISSTSGCNNLQFSVVSLPPPVYMRSKKEYNILTWILEILGGKYSVRKAVVKCCCAPNSGVLISYISAGVALTSCANSNQLMQRMVGATVCSGEWQHLCPIWVSL